MLDEKRWVTLWNNLGANGDPLEVYEMLVERYDETHRRFHTLLHINDCLKGFDEARHSAKSPLLVEYALVMHDVIYDGNPGLDEERSAEFAYQVLVDAGLPSVFAFVAYKLIVDGTRHVALPPEGDAQLVSDIDLSSLGVPPDSFDLNRIAIRHEYHFIPDDEFARGSIAFCDRMLERQRIYFTDHFFAKYEARARANLTRFRDALACPECAGKGEKAVGAALGHCLWAQCSWCGGTKLRTVYQKHKEHAAGGEYTFTV